MIKVVVFDIRSYFEGKGFIEYLDVNTTEYITELLNCTNSRDGGFMQLRIYKDDGNGGKGDLVAEADTRYPCMIRIPGDDKEVIKNLKKSLVNCLYHVLILTNCQKGFGL